MGTQRRVVITGLGLVTPLGIGALLNWTTLTSGATATRRIEDSRFKQLPCQVAAFVPRGDKEGELDLSKHFTATELRTLTLATTFSLIATKEALTDSSWQPTKDEDFEKTGVAVGLGLVDLEDILSTGKALEKRYTSVNPYFIPKILNNMAAGHISMKHGFLGPNHCVSTACATGCHAIGDAFRFIKSEDADVMVCGGTEASISPLALAGFCRLRALSTKFNDVPGSASRPFDSNRDGFVMGEGAGIIVLEDLEHALNRNANIYGEILGYGLSGDAHHITSPREDGRGVSLAMHRAIKSSGIMKEEIGYINAHATSTPLGDAIEINAIKSVFGMHVSNLMVSSTKGATGHLLGAAGAVEAIYTVLACHSGYIPPTANLTEINPDFNIDLVALQAKPWLQASTKRIALCNSLGFGGTNVSLCISSYE